MSLIRGEPYVRTKGGIERVPTVERGMSARWSPLSREEMLEIEEFERLVGKIDHGISVDALFAAKPADGGERPRAARRTRRRVQRASTIRG